jgi:hypothetical protein
MEIAQIRQAVLQALAEYGVTATEPNWETLLITDGRYVGRRFEFEDVRAFWFRERHVVEFYDHSWQLLGELKLPGKARVA